MLITFPVKQNQRTNEQYLTCSFEAHLFGLVHSSGFTKKWKGMLMMFTESKIKEQTNETYIRSFVQSPVRSGSLKKAKGNVNHVPCK